MWEDIADLYTDDAVANYPAGTYVGHDSIRKHLYMNVGGGQVGENGLPDNRIYNHMNIQPVVHLEPGGQTAKGRWRAFAMFGSFGGGATWAEGVYEMTYAKVGGVWKISESRLPLGLRRAVLDGLGAARAAARGAAPRGPRNLPHPADRARNEACGGFPAACVGPFHYTNPGVTDAGHVWTTVTLPPATAGGPARAIAPRTWRRARSGSPTSRRSRTYRRSTATTSTGACGTRSRICSPTTARSRWAQRGVYVGKPRVREFLNLLGPVGLKDGELNDHVQLQVVVHVAPDGRSAKARSRELNMTGVFESHGEWSEGVYENTFVKENGVWKIKDLRYFPTFISDYDEGWAGDAQPAPTASAELPPDRPPTSVYAIYPKAHIPPFHYDNPVSGAEPRYPKRAAGRAMPRSPPCARPWTCRAPRAVVSRSKPPRPCSRRPSGRSRARRTSTRSTT